MLIDINILRRTPQIIKEALNKRGLTDYPLDELINTDKEWRKLQTELEKLRHRKNELTIMVPKTNNREQLMNEIKIIDQKIEELEIKTKELRSKVQEMLALIPNIPHESVPYGKDASDNVVIRTWGEPKKFDFKPRAHYELGELLDIIDFDRGVKLTGSGFYVLKGWGARLERALINFMLDIHKAQGYTEIFPPILVKTDVAFGTGHLPKFADDMYKTIKDDLWLIPTAELPLVAIHKDEVLNAKELPKYYTAYTPCFRREAGRHVDLKGILRVHQFNKVEMVKITLPEKSFEELEKMVNDAEEILQKLEIPYRVVALCTGDLGFASAKTYDIEAWMPSQNKYIEVSSVSNCTDFQARRANIKFVGGGRARPEYVHTLNGSGLAVGRTMAALLENHQEPDGSVRIPKGLQPYIGTDMIKPSKT